MDNNPPKKRSRSKAEPKATTPNVEVSRPNKYAPKARIGKATVGRPAGYVETVGLGKLKVIHATNTNDNPNVQPE
jgi:hypothetical protein